MTENEIRNNVIYVAECWNKAAQGNQQHLDILNTYNSYKPLARGYAVQVNDAWCATFVSAVAIKAGLTDIIPLECGCNEMIKKAQSMGIWVEDDAYVPNTGDLIFYDWSDSGIGDNRGSSSHVGFVRNVPNGFITVIEGNMNKAFGYRNISVNGRYIRGYACPKYYTKVSSPIPCGLDVKVLGSYMVGETLSAKDFEVIVKMSDGSVVKNPEYWNASPLHLSGESNQIRITYHGLEKIVIVSAKYPTHKVLKGETLWSIATKELGSGTKYPEIVAINGINPSTPLEIGQILKIPKV